MSNQIIKIRRGTKTQLEGYGALSEGELGFCTDSREVFVGNGVENIFIGRALMGSYNDRPNAGYKGRFYFVTSGDNVGFLYIDDGISWYKANATSLTDLTGDLDQVNDGMTYGKVRNSELEGGKVKKLDDHGGNAVSAGEARSHLDNPNLHRTINDSSDGNTDLWSADKIKSEIHSAVKGLEWQDSVISRGETTPPVSPETGARYIVGSGAVDAWANQTNTIAEYNGSTWVFYGPEIGWSVYVDAESKNYVYNSGHSWVRSGEANQTVNTGSGLTGGGNSDDITINIGGGYGITVNTDSIAVKPYQGLKVDGNGVSADVDNSSIILDSTNGNKLTVNNVDGGSF